MVAAVAVSAEVSLPVQISYATNASAAFTKSDDDSRLPVFGRYMRSGADNPCEAVRTHIPVFILLQCCRSLSFLILKELYCSLLYGCVVVQSDEVPSNSGSSWGF